MSDEIRDLIHRDNLPPTTTNFKTRRLEQLSQKIDHLELDNSQNTIICAITGIAGCGKSELAMAYARRYCWNSSSKFLWRLDPDFTSSHEEIRKFSYNRAHLELLHNFRLEKLQQLPYENNDQFSRRRNNLLWDKIHQYSCRVIIFDNADAYANIKNYLPENQSANDLILITTQDPQFLAGMPGISFSEADKGLEPLEAVELLTILSSVNDTNSAWLLVSDLDHSPLAIRVAAGYIELTKTDFTQYRKLLQNRVQFFQEISLRSQEHVFAATVENYNKVRTLHSAIQLLVERVKLIYPLVFECLQYFGYINNKDIPRELLWKLYTYQDESNPLQHVFESIISDNLIRYSLLSLETRDKYYLHRSTQLVLRGLTHSPMETIRKVVNLTLQWYPYDYYNSEKLRLCQDMQPHFIALKHHIGESDITHVLLTENIQLMLILGKLYFKQSQYPDASEHLNQAWKLVQPLSNQHPEIKIEILRYQAQVNLYLRQCDKAITYIDQAIEIGHQIWSHDWRLARLHNIRGDILRYDLNADIQEALRSFRTAEQISQGIKLHSNFSDLQLAYSNRGIGRCYRLMRQPKEAIKYYNKTLEIRRRYLADKSVFITRVYHDLATLGHYNSLDQFTDVGIDRRTSIEYLNKYLSSCNEMYGTMSYEGAYAHYWLSRLLYLSDDQQDWEKALQHQDLGIEIRTQFLGPDGQELIPSRYWKGRILEKLNRKKDAMEEYQRNLEMTSMVLGRRKFWIEESQRRLSQNLEKSKEEL